MIIGAGHEDLAPRLGMGWRKLLALRKIIDPLRRKRTKNEASDLAYQAVPESVDPFEMFEQQDQFLDMIGSQAAIFVVERMGHSVADPVAT